MVGAVAGLAAVLFHLSIGWMHLLLFGSQDLTSILRPWYAVLLIPAAGAFSAGILLKYFIPEARGSGIPQTKIAYIVHNGRIPLRVWLGKFFLGVLNIGSGSSLGREGPTVQICAGLASWLGQIFSLKRSHIRSLVPVGAAAGLAAAFNTPMAAITFTLEEMLGDLNARVLGAIVFASVSAAVVERTILGNQPVFSVPGYELVKPAELIVYALVGIVCAAVSIVFQRGLLLLRERCLSLKGFYSILITTLGGLVVGAIGIFFPQILAVGYPSVNNALTNQYGAWLLLALLLLKLLTTIISYGTGSSGGIFAPTLFMGAMAGGLVATVANAAFPDLISQPGGFALVGMGAAFAATIRAPMTSVLIIFELTQDYNIILALMVANVVSFGISKRWNPKPIYRSLSAQDGVQLPDHETDQILHEIHVTDAMVRDVITLPEDITISEAWERVKDLSYTGFPVMNRQNRMRGIVSHSDFNQAHALNRGQEQLINITTTQYVLHAHPDQSLDSAMAKLGARRISHLPVVSREDPTLLLGIITAEDVIKAFGEAINRRGEQTDTTSALI